jgi:hypothetical protein
MNSTNKKLTGSLPSHGSSSGETETEADKDTQCISITPPAIPMLCIVLATDGVWLVSNNSELHMISTYNASFSTLSYVSLYLDYSGTIGLMTTYPTS